MGDETYSTQECMDVFISTKGRKYLKADEGIRNISNTSWKNLKIIHQTN